MKTNIAIIYGGMGSEHEVSIASAKTVFSELYNDRYEIQRIFIRKDGVCIKDQKAMTIVEALEMLPKSIVVIPILHGSYGEGGVLQKILEDRNISYTFSDSVSSSLAMDKYAADKVLCKSGLLTPYTVLVTSTEDYITIPFPLIIKPRDEGSSIDLYKVANREELELALKVSLAKHPEMLVQECIEGREFTCGVFENKNEKIALLPTEIILAQDQLFDYHAKYTTGGCQEITPADIPEIITKKIQEVAIAAHIALRCKDISRTDMIMKKDGTIVVLEVNTIPGMTATSFIPAQAVASGYTLGEILDIVISNHL